MIIIKIQVIQEHTFYSTLVYYEYFYSVPTTNKWIQLHDEFCISPLVYYLLNLILIFHVFSPFLSFSFNPIFSTYRKGLYISDVPIHDATRDLVLLSEQFEAGYKLTRNLEVLTDKLQQTYRELESEKQKTDR